MTVIRMSAPGLSVEERSRLTERLTDVACDETGRSKEDLTVYVYDYRTEQPRH
ncbi:hypothetical protein L2W58_08440 [Dethiosulfovibrio sp. F2B]|uniref:tautomerase family protein n=1 Tax=Dethiosulfovibrio faecalis TaxID=2720018 RepID=UPI001F21C18D|nr:hypothetical protein [Dethiosulfovibrio faecalis]MCF4151829.1 hypothetical protein [Dethiosulfovibrio faecalis]